MPQITRARKHLRRLLPAGVGLLVLAAAGHIWLQRHTRTVRAIVETDPVPHGSDAADDICIWRHPTQPERSTVIGTDKDGGIAVYSLDGTQLQYRADGRMNNVDVRDAFPWPAGAGAVVAASNRSSRSIDAYRVDPATARLLPAGKIEIGFEPYGLCLYHSSSSPAFYAFVTGTDGRLEQWRLTAADGLTGTRVRQFRLDGKSEGCVADDETAVVYIAEEKRGVWAFAAEPDAGTTGELIIPIRFPGPLRADVEGLALYCAADSRGYLLVSSQGNSRFAVFSRRPPYRYLGSFRIAGGTVDGVSGTDGIDVANVGLGRPFERGLFVAQDDRNDDGNQNFKLVRWDDIAGAFDPPLMNTPDHRTRAGETAADEGKVGDRSR